VQQTGVDANETYQLHLWYQHEPHIAQKIIRYSWRECMNTHTVVTEVFYVILQSRALVKMLLPLYSFVMYILTMVVNPC